MNNYKKHFKADGSFYIKEYRTGGRIRIVGEDNSSYLVFIEDEGNTVDEVAYVAPPTATEQALSRKHFKKIEIRRAVIALDTATENGGLENKLDVLLTNSKRFRDEWNENYIIDLDLQVTKDGLLAAEITADDVADIKLQIGGLND